MAGKMPRGGTGERTRKSPAHAPNHRTEKQCQREHEKAIGDQIPTGDSVRLTCEEIAIANGPAPPRQNNCRGHEDHCDEDRANPALATNQRVREIDCVQANRTVRLSTSLATASRPSNAPTSGATI